MTTGRIVRPPQADVNLREQKFRDFVVRDVALNTAYTNITSSYTVVAKDRHIFCDTTSNAITVTLPDPTVCAGKTVVVKDSSGTSATNNITISTPAGDIDGAATVAMAINYLSYTLVSNGINWRIV